VSHLNSPELFAFISAELLLVLTRSRELTLLLKADAQRTEFEKAQVAGGLLRALLIEAFVFVPVSVGLMNLCIAPFIPWARIGREPPGRADFALLGLISYGFPFATVRQIVTRMAIKTILEAAELLGGQQPAAPAPIPVEVENEHANEP
jgi:hypothetical protein